MRQVSGFVMACLLTAACGDGANSPSGGGSVQQIIGNERLGWNQQADTADAVAALRFVAYVDDMRFDMGEVSCSTTPGATGFPCSGRLPTMSAGRHALRLASVSPDNLESDRSEPLQVIVATSSRALTLAASAARAGVIPADLVSTTVDGVRLRLETLAEGLVDATDLAIRPDGALLVAERAGRLRIVQSGVAFDPGVAPALALPDVAAGAGGLLSLALDPQFDRNGFAYVLYAAPEGTRLARFRASGERFVDRAVLIDRMSAPSAEPAAALRFGPDAKLYAGIDDGGNARRAGDLGSFAGKVLRFNADGTTPADQAGGTPIYVADINAPKGLAWSSARGPLWVAQQNPSGPAGELRGVVSEGDRTAQRGRIAVRYMLPADAAPSPMVVYRGGSIRALEGNLLMAEGDAGGLLRIRFDESDPLKVVSAEHLFDGVGLPVRAIAAAPDGTIYLATSSTVMRIVF